MVAPLIVGAGISALGSVLGGKGAKKANQQAVQATQYAADQSAAVQQNTYNQSANALAPLQQQGQVAGNALQGFLGLGAPEQQQASQQGFQNFITNSDYGFQLGNGQNAINSGYAGNGVVRSGAAMKDIENHRQGLQSGFRGQYMNALGGQQGVGLSATTAQAGVGTNFANAMGNIYQGQGDNLANAALMRAQNNGQMWNSLATTGASLFGSRKW